MGKVVRKKKTGEELVCFIYAGIEITVILGEVSKTPMGGLFIKLADEGRKTHRPL